MWTQITKVDGIIESEIKRTDKEIIQLFAQKHFLRDAGEDISMSQRINDSFEVECYISLRKLKDKTIETYYINEDLKSPMENWEI